MSVVALGLNNVAVFQHRLIELSETQRESERILAPGAAGAAGDSYKLLRTQVLGRLQELAANTLAVLSSSGGDGKTLTAINLAIAVAADHGHTALLIDLDFRRPSIHRRLGFEPELGIEDCLQQRRPIHQAMIKIAGYERLTVLPARLGVEQSSELIGTQCMGELMQELRTRYSNRILILDLPPVLRADDALACSRHIEAGLLVVSAGKTQREEVTRSLTLLSRLPILGTVLNQSREPPPRYN